MPKKGVANREKSVSDKVESFKVKGNGNQGPIPEIGLLYFNKLKGTGNLTQWLLQLHLYVGHYYGRAQDFIETGNKYVPARIPTPDPDDFDKHNDPYGIKLKSYQKQEQRRDAVIAELEQLYPRIYNVIMGQLSRESTEMIKQHVDWLQADTDKDPIELIKIIRKTHLQPMTGSKTLDSDTAWERYYSLRQDASTTLPAHKKSFDDAIIALEAAGETKPSEAQLAARFVASLDPNRYAQWKVELENNTKAGLDVMPGTLADSYTRAFTLKKVGHGSQPIADAAIFVTHASGGRGRGGRGRRDGPGRGHNGGRGGRGYTKASTDAEETKSQTEEKSKKSSRGGKSERSAKSLKCTLCGEPDHYMRECPMLDECKEFLAEKRTEPKSGGLDGVHLGRQSSTIWNSMVLPTVSHPAQPADKCIYDCHYENEDYVSKLDLYDCESDESECDCISSQLHQAIVLPTVRGELDDFDILLDNQASVPVIRNPAILTDIRPAQEPVYVDGIGGQLLVDQVGEVEDFGTAYHHPDAVANVLSFAAVEDRGDIKYSQQHSSFTVVINKHRYTFKRSTKGRSRNLYVCNLRQHAYGRFGIVCVQTVADNEALYTKREIGDARRARDLSRLLGYPSMQSLAKIVKSMSNPPVSIYDVYRAARIWGPEAGYIKGTTRNKKTERVSVESLPIQAERSEQTLHVDLMYVEGEAFLLSKSTPCELLMIHHLGHGKGARASGNIKARLVEQFASYTAAGYKITTMLTDNEGGVMANRTAIEERGVAVNPSSAVRTVKSRVRTHIHSLPFLLCRTLLVWLVLFVVSRINCEPSATSADGLCPRERFLRRGLDFKRDLRTGFGDYVQVQIPRNITNGMEARTEGAIALLPTGNLQGSTKFYLLNSGRTVTRDQWIPLPMPQTVIDHLNKLADKQPMSRDPAFTLGEHSSAEIEDATEAKSDQSHIPEGPLRVVPNQIDLTESTSEPVVMVPDTSVVSAANDISTNVSVPSEIMPIETPEQLEDEPPPMSEHDNGVQSPLPPVEPSSEQRYNTRRSARIDYSKMNKYGKSQEPTVRHYGLHISLNKALNKLGRKALRSAFDEIYQFHSKSVGTPICKRDLTFKQLKAVIRSSMFFKEKYLSTGEFDKLKARLVAGGHMQDRSLYEDCLLPLCPQLLSS